VQVAEGRDCLLNFSWCVACLFVLLTRGAGAIGFTGFPDWLAGV
jgi:hypothetical protein